MKIGNRGKFHQYSICDCQGINLQCFAYRFGIMKQPYFGGFRALSPSIMVSNFAEILTSGSIPGNQNIVWNFFEGFEFLWKRDGPKVWNFGPTLNLCFPLKMAEIEKKVVRKNFSHWAIRKYKNQDSFSCPLSGRDAIIFCTIWAIFSRKQGGVTSQRVRIKIWHILFHH